MTTTHINAHTRARQLTNQIETKQRHQLERRIHLASLQSVIDYYDREINNLKAQLEGAMCGAPKQSSPPAQSAAAASAPPPAQAKKW